MGLRSVRTALVAGALLLSANQPLFGEPIAVRQPQGAARGFVVIRSDTGSLLGYGESSQVARGERVTSHLTLHFRDGSLDDEIAIFTQRGTFRLVSDHHVQRGPFFAKPTDILVEASGDITTRSTEKDGTPKVETQHIDLPPDVANGFIANAMLNIGPNAPEFKFPMVAAAGKGRLIHLDVVRAGRASFSVAGTTRTATVFRLHPELGGVAGVVAPVIGKQPADIFVWILEGQPPAFVREIGQLSEGGPIVSIESAGTVFPPAASAKQ